MKKVALLIDGGYLRPVSRKAGHTYNPDFIEKISHLCIEKDEEELFRILYYDCAPFVGQVRKPVSGESTTFEGSDEWLRDLAQRDFFAVRRGVLKFRGWKPKKIPIESDTLSDEHFAPVFEQKGVDMRIGLDIAALAISGDIERALLITADTDFIPAMKHGRIAGLQIVSVILPKEKVSREFLAHVDIKRDVDWPR